VNEAKTSQQRGVFFLSIPDFRGHEIVRLRFEQDARAASTLNHHLQEAGLLLDDLWESGRPKISLE
jgi:hypothetical protein